MWGQYYSEHPGDYDKCNMLRRGQTGSQLRVCQNFPLCDKNYNIQNETMETIREYCRSYLYPTLSCDRQSKMETVAKNPYCTLCNKAIMYEVGCTIPLLGMQSNPYMWHFRTQVSESHPKLKTFICPLGETPDFISKMCKPIVCPYGFELKGSKCVVQNSTQTLRSFVESWDCQSHELSAIFKTVTANRFCLQNKINQNMGEGLYPNQFYLMAENEGYNWFAYQYVNVTIF